MPPPAFDINQGFTGIGGQPEIPRPGDPNAQGETNILHQLLAQLNPFSDISVAGTRPDISGVLARSQAKGVESPAAGFAPAPEVPQEDDFIKQLLQQLGGQQ